MLYPLVRPLLFRFDAERAHDAALSEMARLAERPRLAQSVRRLLARPARRATWIMGLEFPHPIGLAAGFDKNGVAPLAWWALGFGFIELGTVTPKPQAGQPRPRMFRLPRRRGLVNRMGFNNDGAEIVAKRLARQAASGCRPPVPVGISVGRNAATMPEAAADDYAAAAQRLAPFADFITLNVSSPNTPGLRELQERRALAGLLATVRQAAGKKPLLVKLAPELDDATLDAVADTCAQAGADGIIATNTLSTTACGDLPEGGLSGRPLRAIARRRVRQVRRRVGDRVAVVGCGGIDTVAAAQAMFDAGADLIQIYTGLVYEGPFLAARLSRALYAGRRQRRSDDR